MKTAIFKPLYFKIRGRRKKRSAMEQSLPDLFQMMANGMRAGLSLPQVIETVAKEEGFDWSGEFQALLFGLRGGFSLEEVLRQSILRTDMEDYSLPMYSILLLKNIGGNMAVHFEKLAGVIRSRQRATRKISLLLSQNRLQGRLLVCMPPFFLAALRFLSPDFISPLFETFLGGLTLCAALVLNMFGFFWLRQSAKVQV